MLRYKVSEVPETYIAPRRYVVIDNTVELSIATCYKKEDADSIVLAMNFYNDWVLIDRNSKWCTGCYSMPCICNQLHTPEDYNMTKE